MVPLPIDPVLPEVLAKLRAARAVVLVAEPGAGKTTRVPPAIVTQKLLAEENPNLILLQPRRVAARAAAARIAEENQWELGREVGYQIRFERRISAATRLHVMTEGVLTRRLLDDPYLEGVGCVVLDEFHERSLHTDLAVALLREVQQTVRPDLMIVVMSATLEAEPVARFLGDAPVVRSEGRTFPVHVTHAGATPRLDLPARITRILADLDDDGDALVFLPGVAEINRTLDAIDALGRDDLAPIPLHGSLAAGEQFAALRPAPRGKRKIVIATNIAETSLTIEGVTTVIDSGLVRVAGFDPARGMDRLELKRISRASATQRAGRAGRTAPGHCIRLWSAIEDKALEAFEVPEVRRIDLAPTVLALHAWGHPDPRGFGWYEPPDERAVAYAERLLKMLGATTGEERGRITPVGRQLLSMPVHPRLGRLLLAAAEAGLPREGAAVAALLSEKDIVRRDTHFPPSERRPTVTGPSDLLIRLELLESGGQAADRGALHQARQARDHLERLIPRSRRRQTDDETLLRLPLWAYPDRVCRRRANDPAAGVMVGGGGVRLAPESVVRRHEFFVALDARQDQRNPSREAMISIASGIEMRWLEEMFPQEIRHERRAVYDEQRDRVVGTQTVLYRDLPLREHADAAVDATTAERTLIDWAIPRAWNLIRDDERAQRWLNRLALLGAAMPDKGWPALDDTLAGQIITRAAAGKRSLASLRPALLPTLQGLLEYPLDRLLETDAPESVEVPTGNRIKLDYPEQTDGVVHPPVLAVRLQELFGMNETPRVAGGRVPVRLHLLGPNFRPVQVTDDLRSFWSTTYFQVRKDLRVRYPKHAWPEDPLNARPEAKGGRRRA